jgi:acylphosphatase
MTDVHHETVYFTGRVQGVGFRYTTLQIAKEFEVAGVVRNLADGRVYLEVEGRAADVAALLRDPNTCLYVCGLKSMEAGVLEALRDIAGAQGLDWPTLHAQLKTEGRLHFETY